MKLITISNPEGQRPDYLFLEDEDTGDRFKALYHMDTTAEGQSVLKISLSQVSKEGQALLNPGLGEADVAWHSHTFTEEELQAPGFDLAARVSELLHMVAGRKQRERKSRDQVLNVGSIWGPGKLDLQKRLPLSKPAKES